MNKKILFLSIATILLTSCSFSKKTPIEFVNQIYINKKCQIEVTNLTKNLKEKFIIDNDSFIHDDVTYYKYLYKENYQLYDDNFIEDNKDLNIEYGKCFIEAFNDKNYNATYYIENNKYIINEKDIDKFDFSFLSNNITNISFYLEDNQLIYNLIFEKEEYQLNIFASEKRILPFNINEDKINNFYLNNQINESELANKINNKENFILIIESSSCKACKYSQIYYALYTFELNKTIYTIDESDIKDLKNRILENIHLTYDNQKNDYKRNEYQKYPKDYFLTPTAINFIQGNEKYVFLGFGKNDVNAFYKFCNEK